MLIEHIDPNLKLAERVEQAKGFVKTQGYYELSSYTPLNELYSTIYLKEVTDHSFHIYGIFEPAIDSLSGVNGIFTEIFYDLKNKEHKVFRNFKEVNFSARNIDGLLQHISINKFLNFLEKGQSEDSYFPIEEMYTDITHSTKQLLIIEGNHIASKNFKLSEILEALMLKFHQLETLYKSGYNSYFLFGKIEKSHTWESIRKLPRITEYRGDLPLLDFSKTKPHQILGMTKNELKRYMKYRDDIYTQKITDFAGESRNYTSIYIACLRDWQVYASASANLYRLRFVNQEHILTLQEHSDDESLEEVKQNQLKIKEIQKDEEFWVNFLQKSAREFFGVLDYLEGFVEEYGYGNTYIFLRQFNMQDYLTYKIAKIGKNPPPFIRDTHYYHSRDAFKEAGRHNVDIKTLVFYIFYRCHFEQGITNPHGALEYYKDYLRMMREMRAPSIDRYPRSLILAHDVATMNYKVVINEIEKQRWSELLEEKQNKFNWENKEYCIMYPLQAEDLVKEGNALNHCVGSYVKSVLKQTTDVLFLRKKDDINTPLITIEVKDNKVRQSYGKFNSRPEQKEREIIEKYKKERGFL